MFSDVWIISIDEITVLEYICDNFCLICYLHDEKLSILSF